MRTYPILAGIVFGLLAGSAAVGQQVWRESSYEDFRDGTFNDGGANMYVSAQGRMQTINRWDVNDDGYVDIVLCNTHPIVEALDLAIYWGNSRDFSPKRRSYLPVDGAQAVASADFNNDGRLDLAVANYSNGTWTEMDSFAFFGTKPRTSELAKHPTSARELFPERLNLPTKSAQGVACADFNRDGFVDIVYAQSAGHWEYRRDRDQEYRSPSRIYWGAAGGFTPDQYLDLPAQGATAVAAADLNDDGWPEVVFANQSGTENTEIPCYVYWGGAEGFSPKHRSELPANGANAVTLADVNNDQHPDIVIANGLGEVSVAYLNQNGGFNPQDHVKFPTSAAKGCAVADFNQDGYADVFFSNHENHKNRITDSFLYFGSDTGFKVEDRQPIGTIGAWGASAADLNGDGWVDLFVSNYQEHYSYEVPSFVYWNSPQGFDSSLRTPIYEHGATGNCLADFDGDGHLDILVCSFIAGSRGDYDRNYVYLGDSKGQFSAGRRLELAGRESYEFAIADFDDDGMVDLASTNSGEVTRRDNETWIYWNENQTFHPWRITGLSSYLSLGVECSDLDKDGYLDLLVQNFAPDPRATQPGSHIYWGSADGFVATDRTTYPHYSRIPAIADLNQDGHLDIVCGTGMKRWAPHQTGAVIYWGDGSRYYGTEHKTLLDDTSGVAQPEIADLNKDGLLDIVLANGGFGVNALVLYGNKEGDFNKSRRDELPIEASSTCSIADVDQDGWLDIVFPSYKAEGPPVSRTTISRIWRGGPKGFQKDRMVRLPTHSGTGSLVSDFNRDGYPDVFLYCHRKEGSSEEVGNFGDHDTSCFLYWGAADGFDPKRRLAVPSLGVHNDAGVDIGHRYNRRFQFEYLSSPYKTAGRKPVRIDWSAEEPHGTSVKFQLRVAADKEGLATASWQGADGIRSYFTNRNTSVKLPEGNWIQYKAVLDTVNGASSPVLNSVEVHFE